MSYLKVLAFDLDDVICSRDKKYESLGKNKYLYCEPNIKIIKYINSLYKKKKYKIIIYTARGMTQYKGNVTKIKKELGKITRDSLIKWNLKYHQLVFGKIHYDLLIDDKSYNYNHKRKSLKQLGKIINIL